MKKSEEKDKNELMFQTMIDDFKLFHQEGIEIETENGIERVYFEIVLLVGDNAGLHSMMVFVESLNANFSCGHLISSVKNRKS